MAELKDELSSAVAGLEDDKGLALVAGEAMIRAPSEERDAACLDSRLWVHQ